MYKRAKWAKDHGLNWQAMVIEEAETELKVIIKDAVLYGKPWQIVNFEIIKAVDVAVAELESETLKAKTRASLLSFATIEYRRLKRATAGLNIALASMVSVLYTKKAAPKEKTLAVKKITASVPQLERFQDVEGQYWERAVPLKMWTKDYHAKVDKAFQQLVNSSAKDDYASNVSLRNVAEMTVRYEHNMGEIERLKNEGVNLVWTSTHANCSKRCERWQGKLYSLDGTSGTIDGQKYIPLETAMNVPYTTKAGKTYNNGIISGYNCRHRLIPYKKGNKPFEIPAKIVDRERRLEQQQRAYERVVRDKKAEALIFKEVDAEKSKQARAEARRVNAEYEAFSRRHEIPFDKERTKIFETEAEYKAARLN